MHASIGKHLHYNSVPLHAFCGYAKLPMPKHTHSPITTPSPAPAEVTNHPVHTPTARPTISMRTVPEQFKHPLPYQHPKIRDAKGTQTLTKFTHEVLPTASPTHRKTPTTPEHTPIAPFQPAASSDAIRTHFPPHNEVDKTSEFVNRVQRIGTGFLAGQFFIAAVLLSRYQLLANAAKLRANMAHQHPSASSFTISQHLKTDTDYKKLSTIESYQLVGGDEVAV